jgi:HAD superfamily hydrolase (TIGR01549 family)
VTLQVRAILFDLDDTLLGNDINGFLNNYLPLLAKYVSEFIDEKQFVAELMYGTQAMIDNVDRNITNAEVFGSTFSSRTGLDRATFETYIDKFYRDEFGKLQSLTRIKPEAKELVNSCLDAGYSVVIATNPLFPMTAIEQRLNWAGIPVAEHDFALVTSYENMHTCKPHHEYYDEILFKIGVKPEQAIMVGDDRVNDISGGSSAGLHTFWITGETEKATLDIPHLVGKGSLDSFFEQITTGNIKPSS